MLEHTRAVTLQEINDLSVEQLDSIMSSGGNSIGAFIKAYSSYRKAHQLISFQERDFTKEELEIWEDALYLGESGRTIRGHEIQYYVQLLQKFEKNL